VLRLDQFRLQVFQVRIIQVKLPLQGPIGDTLVLPEPIDDVCENFLKLYFPVNNRELGDTREVFR